MNDADQNWLKAREQHWDEFRKNQHSASKKEIAALKCYFFEGDLQPLLEVDPEIDIGQLVWLSPATEADELRQTIIDYWFWVLEDPDCRGPYEKYSELDRRFNFLEQVLFHPYVHSGAAIGNFRWVYGHEYKSERALTFNSDNKTASVSIKPNIHELQVVFLEGLVNYFWRENTTHQALTAYTNRHYFLGFYNKLDDICFQLDMPRRPRVITPDGKKYRKANISFNHWFVACLNGYTTKFEKEEGIETLKCYKPKELELFRIEFEKFGKHSLYNQLEEHILSHDKNEIVSW